jgi:hypothetical protein
MGNATPNLGNSTATAAVTLAGTTLTNMQDFTTGVLSAAETVFKNVTNALSTGGALSMAEMIKYQSESAKFTLTATIMSAIIKEVIDTMKGIANKI